MTHICRLKLKKKGLKGNRMPGAHGPVIGLPSLEFIVVQPTMNHAQTLDRRHLSLPLREGSLFVRDRVYRVRAASSLYNNADT